MARINARRVRWLLLALAGSAAFAALWNSEIRRLVADRWSGSHAAAQSMSVGGPISTAYRNASANDVPPRFSFEQTWTSPVSAWSLATGDFNGDGRDDLAAMAATLSDYLYVPLDMHLFLQQGNGTLAPPIVLPFPGSVYSTLGMVTGDFNEDGIDDIALSQRDYPALYYLMSQPGGGFAWRLDDWSTAFPWGPVHVGDMDGDGHLDIVMQLVPMNVQIPTDSPGQVVTYFGDGSGNFPRHGSVLTSQVPLDSALGQLDGDGRPDFLAAPLFSGDHRPVMLRNNGEGGWLAPSRLGLPRDEYFRGAAIADLTADGRDDAVVISNTQPSRISIYPQLADGSLATQATIFAAGGYSSFTGHADLNGDGRQDFVQLDEGSQYSRFFYYLSDAYGLGYPKTQVVQTGDNNQYLARDLAIGDFNHDGIGDVAIATQYHQLRVWTGKLTPFAGSGGLPGAPSVLQVLDPQPDDASPLHNAHVTVGAVTDDGGNAITGYSVFSIPGGAIDDDAESPANMHRLRGLVTGSSYVFYARAVNAAGMGPPSAMSAPLIVGTQDDPNTPPVLSFAVERLKETDVGPWAIEIRGTLDKPAPAGGARFDVATSDGTATAGIDYVASFQGDVLIPEGELLTPPIFITVLGDQQQEVDEDLHLVLSDLQGITAQQPAPTLVIDDDDPDGTSIGLNIPVVVEGDAGGTVVTLTVRISKALPHDVVFDLGTGSTTAEAGVDYEPLDLVGLRIPAGQTSLQVPFTVYGDTVFEAEERVGVALNNFQGGVVDGESDISIRIIDNDPAPTLSISDVAIEEGNQGPVAVKFRAQLTARMPHDVNFSAATEDGSAKGGSDYVSRYQGGIIIPAGEPGVDVYVKVLPDTRLEPDESFSLRLENAYGVVIADDTGVAILVNDDVANGIAVDDVSVTEGGVARFVVRLSEPAAQAVGFDAWTSPGTAFEGVDFPAVHLVGLVIPAGSTSLAVDVPTNDDADVEDNETFVLNLSNVTGATVSDAQGKGRILNDDLATLSIGDVSVVEGNEGAATSVYFEVRLSRPMPSAVSFVVNPAQGGTADWNDTSGPYKYSYDIDPGRTRLRFEVRVWGDSDFEPDETFLMQLMYVEGAVVGDSVGQGTIINDDAEPAPARLSRRER